jgi:hypothetical protein
LKTWSNEECAAPITTPDNKLRASLLADPAGARKNTKEQHPAVINMSLVPGDQVEVTVAAKGGGSEAKSKFAMLNLIGLHRRMGIEKLFPPWALAGVLQECSASASAAPPKKQCSWPKSRSWSPSIFRIC